MSKASIDKADRRFYLDNMNYTSKNVYQTSKKEKTQYLPIALSIISLLLSMYTIYVSNFQVSHKIEVSYDNDMLFDKVTDSTDMEISCHAFFQNSGNRTESILSTDYYVRCLADNKILWGQKTDSLFMIPKNEAVVRTYKIRLISSEIDALCPYKISSNPKANMIQVSMYYRYTGKEGTVYDKEIPLMNIKMEPDSRIFNGLRNNNSIPQFKDLLKGRIIPLVSSN